MAKKTPSIMLLEGETTPSVQNIKDGEETLFLAKISKTGGYCAIVAPRAECKIHPNRSYASLLHARVIFGHPGRNCSVVPVLKAHLYSTGGGFIETPLRHQIIFHRQGDERPSVYNGRKVEKVFIAL